MEETCSKNNTGSVRGLKIKKRYTRDSEDVFSLFEYEQRKSSIRHPSGEVVFEMNDVEVPRSWSQVATDILAQKYFRRTGVPKENGETGGEHSVKQVVHRLAACWRSWGEKYGYFSDKEDGQNFYDEISYTLLAQIAAPNSPQWFNTGLHHSYGITGSSQGHYYVDPDTAEVKISSSAYERPQTHACFILPVEDDLVNEGGIMDLLVKEARIFKYGSGAGTNYSGIRGIHEKLSGGGYSSGLMSFLKVADKAAGAIKSGGTTRRAAKMVCVDLDHPEIEEVISWKVNEEKKVAALVAGGFSSDYEGEAYQTVSGQNVNVSVRIPNAFFKKLGDNEAWPLKARTTGETVSTVAAGELWDRLSASAWQCGDPGVQFDTTINEWHTCPGGGTIKASNPCSEFMFLDNTGCNLASINLRKFWNDKTQEFDTESFEHVCRLWTIVLEITTLMAQYPTKEIAWLSYAYRPIGLGYANLGGMLMAAGIAYDSDRARATGGAITSLMTATAYSTSAEIASVLGPFSHYSVNASAMKRVIGNHRAAAYNTGAYETLSIQPAGLDEAWCPPALLQATRKAWDQALERGEIYGFRNAQATVIAPTGTIGLLMDCDTTGIEPDFSIVKFKKLSGGGYFRIINTAVPPALRALGYSSMETEEIIRYVTGHNTFHGAPYINAETLTAKGFAKADLNKLETAAHSAFHLKYLFSVYTLGNECMERLGISPGKYGNPEFNLMEELGFTSAQIEEANRWICGTMTMEGAPYLKEIHLPVFDCANRCGEYGKRFLHPLSHLKMMAAAQPFISGAISKTINFPNECTVEEIKDTLEKAWRMGLKACTIYRDGSKLSQPLSSASSSKNDKDASAQESQEKPDEALFIDTITPELVLKAANKILSESQDTKFKRELSRVVEKKRLPDKRRGFTQKAKLGGHTVFIRTGEYGDGTLGEIFIDMYKEGASFRSLLNCFAVAVSVGLQYGVPLEEYVEKFTFTRFEPAGQVEGQPYIKYATSLPDFIFRMLAWEYLDREDMLHVKPYREKPGAKNFSRLKPELATMHTSPALNGNHVLPSEEDGPQQTQEFLSSMMGDAPICDICGHITVRSGTCYKCLNCGNSLGCS